MNEWKPRCLGVAVVPRDKDKIRLLGLILSRGAKDSRLMAVGVRGSGGLARQATAARGRAARQLATGRARQAASARAGLVHANTATEHVVKWALE